jgi:hypothetical protein
MDAHASATAKADPDNYIKRSRELAEKKLASLYAGVVRAQTVGGVAKHADPVSVVVMRLARKAVMKDKAAQIAAASKADRLALINKLTSAYAMEHDAQLRPRAQKIVALEEGEPVQAKHEPVPTLKKKRAA